MALGADRASILRLVLLQGMRTAVPGVALGVIAALAFTRALAGFLYEVEPGDPLTLLGVATGLVIVSAAASLAPARRATAVDPATVLSDE